MKPTKPPLRMGVIGLGYWGPNLLRNIADVRELELRAVCDMVPDRLQAAARKYPTVIPMDSSNRLINDPSIDAVAIATPVSTHFALAKQALLAGKHVFVEKPLTNLSSKAAELTRIAKQKKRTLMVDHVFVYSPAVRKIKQIIESGELGDLYYFDSVRVNLGLFQKDVNVIWDLAPHDFSIMSYLLDRKPVSLTSTAVKHVRGSGLEDMAYITIRYPNQLIGHVHVNWLAPAKLRTVLIGGSKKMILYDDNHPSEKVKIYDKGIRQIGNQRQVEYRLGDMSSPHIEMSEALKIALIHFAECIATRRSPKSDGIAGTQVVQLLEAADYSAKHNGKEVSL